MHVKQHEIDQVLFLFYEHGTHHSQLIAYDLFFSDQDLSGQVYFSP